MAKKKSQKAPVATEPQVEIIAGIGENEIDVQHMPLAQIRVHNKNDRIRDEAFHASVRELAANMAMHGLLQPITVRVAKGKGGEVFAELIAGERRFLAAQLLKWESIAAILIPEDGPQDTLDIRAAENLQRQNLDQDATAMMVGEMLDQEIEAVAKSQGVKFDALDAPAQDALREAALKRVSARLAWKVRVVRDYAFTSELPEKVLTLARQGRLTLGHMKVLAQVPDQKRMIELAEEHAAGENPLLHPATSVDDLKRDVASEIARLNKAPWDLTVAFGPKHSDGRQYACAKCPHNSLNRTGLFDGIAKPDRTNHFDTNKNYSVSEKDLEGGICAKLSCYRAKVAATEQAWRGAADRIAKKVSEAKPAERAKLAKDMVSEAAKRCEFVPITTFGRLASERVKNRIEASSSKGKAKASSDRVVSNTAEQARWKAQDEHRRSENRWFGEQMAKLEKHFRGWSREQQAMLYLVMSWSKVGNELIGWNASDPTPAKLNALKLLLRNVASMPATSPLGAIVANPPKSPMFFGADGDEMSVEVMKAILDTLAFEYPEPPKLEDFLSKPKEKPAAKKPAAAKGKKPKAPKKGAAKPAAIDDDVELDDESGEA